MFHRTLYARLRGKVAQPQRPLDFGGLIERLPFCESPADVIHSLQRFAAQRDEKLPQLSTKDMHLLVSKIPVSAWTDAVTAACIETGVAPDMEAFALLLPHGPGQQALAAAMHKAAAADQMLKIWERYFPLWSATHSEIARKPLELEAHEKKLGPVLLKLFDACISSRRLREITEILQNIQKHFSTVIQQENATDKQVVQKNFWRHFEKAPLLERNVVALLFGMMETGVAPTEVRAFAEDFYFPLTASVQTKNSDGDPTLITMLLYLAGYANNVQQIEAMWETARIELSIDRSTLALAMCRSCEMLRFNAMSDEQAHKVLNLIEEVYNFLIQATVVDEHHERALLALVEFIERLLRFALLDGAQQQEIPTNAALAVIATTAVHIGLAERCVALARQVFLKHELSFCLSRGYYAGVLRILTADPKRCLHAASVVLLEMARQGYHHIAMTERQTLTDCFLLRFAFVLHGTLRTEQLKLNDFWDIFRTDGAWKDRIGDRLHAILFDGAIVAAQSGGRIPDAQKGTDAVYRPAAGIQQDDHRTHAMLARFWLHAAMHLAVVTSSLVYNTASTTDRATIHKNAASVLKLLRAAMETRYPFISSTLVRHFAAVVDNMTPMRIAERQAAITCTEKTFALTSSFARENEAEGGDSRKGQHVPVLIPLAEEVVWVYNWITFNSKSAKPVPTGARRDVVFDVYQIRKVVHSIDATWSADVLREFAHALGQSEKIS